MLGYFTLLLYNCFLQQATYKWFEQK